MSFIDTHTHLYVEEFDADREAAVERAVEAGAEKLFFPNIDAASVDPMLALCARYPGLCFPMIGLHPTELPADYASVLDAMEQRLADDRHPYIAVGEVGLDFYWDDSRRADQIDAFARQVAWALRYGLPLSVHSRNAHRELLDVLAPFRGKGLTGVFHCFGGTLDEARELLDFEGFVLGIGGVVTFKKSALPDVLAHLPLSRLVLETDSPYLAPVPHRGKRNESAYIPLIAGRLAEIYGLTPVEVMRRTADTALRVFPRSYR